MCFREFISYQCAHRSPPVLRTCAMTTEAHSNPVCDKRPDRQYIADTGCTVCERCHHGRWVMIREREHRWMHERGVCGCDVVFHGLLNTPQVSGLDVSFPISDESRLLGFGIEASECQEAKGKEKATMRKAPVPPLYTEINTPEGRSLVQLRIKSLYAGEWRDDHRALHEAGKCNCRAVFAPVKPMVPDEELTPEEWKMVKSWRDQEDADESQGREAKLYESGYEAEDVAVAQRLREIQETFGSFQVKANEDMAPTQKYSGKISHGSVPILLPSTTIAESSEQGYRRMGRRNAHQSQSSFHGRNSGGKRRGGKDQGRERRQTHPSAQGAAQANSGYSSQSGSGAPASMALASEGWVYDPFTNQMALLAQGQNASPNAPGGYPNSSQLPQLSQAARPAFPTTATQAQRKPEPFRCSPGFDYSSIDDPNYVDVAGTPICGIPIGGEAHMPAWSECVLRKPSQSAHQEHNSREPRNDAAPAVVLPSIVVEEARPAESSPYTVDEEASPVEAETGPYIVVEYNSNSTDSKSDAGYGTADDDSAIADGDLLGPGGSPTSQRRHSALL